MIEFEQKLDPWQEEVLKTEGNIVLRSGRQVGKSFIIGRKSAGYALKNPNKLIMVISKTERQAGLLFAKILHNINYLDKTQIMKGKDRPTKHIIKLKNGTVIHCLPAGDTGFGIMGFTIDLLIADEAAWIPEEVWNSIIPALAITRGEIWLLSTPFLKTGYYYQCFSDPSFTAFHTSSEDCPRRDDVFLARQKEILTKAQYKQMYLGQFVDEIRQFFSDELIRNICTANKPDAIIPNQDYFLGCDVARMDRDQFTFEILRRINKRQFIQVENIVTKGVPIPESTRRIIHLNTLYDFRKEYIDSGGMGITVCDLLREDDENKRKVVEINNASRVYAIQDKGKTTVYKTKKLMKEEMYNNLRSLMENGYIQLLNDDEIKASLKSVQGEHDPKTGRFKIWGAHNGNFTHIAEGIVRAAWASKEKDLNHWVM